MIRLTSVDLPTFGATRPPADRRAAARRRSRCHAGLAAGTSAQIADDHLVQGQLGRVDHAHTRGRRGELGHRRVVAVPADDLVGDRVDVDLVGQLGVPAGDPGLGSATSSTRTSASGATTVVMSRPSATIPPSASAISSLLPGDQVGADVEVGGDRADRRGHLRRPDRLGHVGAVDGDGERRPARARCPCRRPATRSATAAVSVRSTPRCRASQVAARYIAPVSRNARPSRRATPRAVLDFPNRSVRRWRRPAAAPESRSPSLLQASAQPTGRDCARRPAATASDRPTSRGRPSAPPGPRSPPARPRGPGSRPRGPGRARSRCPRR